MRWLQYVVFAVVFVEQSSKGVLLLTFLSCSNNDLKFSVPTKRAWTLNDSYFHYHCIFGCHIRTYGWTHSFHVLSCQCVSAQWSDWTAQGRRIVRLTTQHICTSFKPSSTFLSMQLTRLAAPGAMSSYMPRVWNSQQFEQCPISLRQDVTCVFPTTVVSLSIVSYHCISYAVAMTWIRESPWLRFTPTSTQPHFLILILLYSWKYEH